MPLGSGIAMVGGNLDSTLQEKLKKLFAKIDEKVAEKARQRSLFPSQVKLLQPLKFCVIVGDRNVYVVCSNQNVGGMPQHQFVDWTGKDMNLQSAIFLVHRDLSFESPYGFEFSRNLLDMLEDEQSEHVVAIVDQYIRDELLNLEKLNRMVRINPIFQGRDFLLNNSFVFVCLPSLSHLIQFTLIMLDRPFNRLPD